MESNAQCYLGATTHPSTSTVSLSKCNMTCSWRQFAWPLIRSEDETIVAEYLSRKETRPFNKQSRHQKSYNGKSKSLFQLPYRTLGSHHPSEAWYVLCVVCRVHTSRSWQVGKFNVICWSTIHIEGMLPVATVTVKQRATPRPQINLTDLGLRSVQAGVLPCISKRPFPSFSILPAFENL